jgi:ribosomal protein S18 acetylase RimI-like enzyme
MEISTEKNLKITEPDTLHSLIDFLTEKINAENTQDDAYSFAFCIKDEDQQIIAGCNGSVMFGEIYTELLWIHPQYRHQGLGRKLMEHVHQYGQNQRCRMATVATMDFQNARLFYEKLGYVCEFERTGYTNNATCSFLRKSLEQP